MTARCVNGWKLAQVGHMGQCFGVWMHCHRHGGWCAGQVIVQNDTRRGCYCLSQRGEPLGFPTETADRQLTEVTHSDKSSCARASSEQKLASLFWTRTHLGGSLASKSVSPISKAFCTYVYDDSQAKADVHSHIRLVCPGTCEHLSMSLPNDQVGMSHNWFLNSRTIADYGYLWF